MRISDWSSDVCSSDLADPQEVQGGGRRFQPDRDALRRRLPLQRGLTEARMDTGFPSRLKREGDDAPHGGAAAAGPTKDGRWRRRVRARAIRSEEHTSELQSLMRISYAFFCLKKKTCNHKRQLDTKAEII